MIAIGSVLVRTAFSAFFLGCAGYSAHLSVENRRFQGMVVAAKQLERSRTAFDAEQLDKFTRSEAMDLARSTCRSDILRPALSIELVSASLRDPVLDYDNWSRAILQADNFARHMIRCMPSEGNAWMREAMLSRAVAETPNELSEKVAIAAALSPFEQIQLQARFSFWRRVSPATLALAQDTLSNDLHTIATYGDESLVALVLSSTSGRLKPFIEAELKNIGKERSKKIEQMRRKLSEK